MKIKRFEENIPHEISELICLKCLQRWIGVYPETTLLKDLECTCGEVGYVIKTGQSVMLEDEIQCLTCDHYINKTCRLGLTYNSEIYCEFYKGKGNE